MILQSDPAWVRARIGYATASRANDMRAFLKGGEESAARKAYKIELVSERMCDCATDHPITFPMRFGLENEPLARVAYEVETGELLGPAAFVEHPTIAFLGATPDGFCGPDGLAEFKVPTSGTYAKWLLAGEVPPEHINQMLIQLLCTGRRWCDFVAFNPRVVRGPRLFIRRFEPTADQLEDAENDARVFLAEVDELFARVTQEAA